MPNRFVLLVISLIPALFSSAFSNSEPLIVDVYIDPGHGGSDHGTLGAFTDTNYSEKHVNLEVGLIVKDYFETLSSWNTLFSRTTDIFKSPTDRANEAMDNSARSLVSIHHNSSTNLYKQHTLSLYSRFPYVQHGPYFGTPRDTTDTLALKLSLKISQLFQYGLSNDTIPGIRNTDTLHTVLVRTSMPSAITEASYLTDSTEELKFLNPITFHQEMEASAIFDGWESWEKGQGFGKVDYAYAGQSPTDSHLVRVEDYLSFEYNTNDTFYAPYLGCWNLDQAILLEAINFPQNSYYYVFHHWEHKNQYDSSIISICQTLNWVFNVDSAQDNTHWYVAYFTGGPFSINYSDTDFIMYTGTPDTIHWECQPGVEETGQIILQLSRDNGGTWTTLDTVPYNGTTGNYSFIWPVTGPATQLARLRFLAFDYVDNKDTLVTYVPFVICDGAADSDCDGLNNLVDNCPNISNSNQQDSDGDGDGNACDNCPTIANANQSDVDVDGWGDLCDNCPDSFQTVQSNADGDLYGDMCDNCQTVANNNQADSDSDGRGNVCDNCPNTYNPSQTDIDNDGLGDACDTVLNWQMTYNLIPDKVAYSIQQAFGGWYILCGYRDTLTYGQQLNLRKINTIGNTYEDKLFGGLGIEQGYCVRQTADSGYVSVGYSSSSGTGDVHLLKASKFLGTPLTPRYFGGSAEDAARHVELTSDGGCIIAGHTKSFGAGDADFYVVKTNSSYDMQWFKTFGGTQADYAYSIQPTISSGYAVAGITNSFGAGNSDMYLLKLNSNGDSVWSKTYGYTNFDSLFSMQQTIDKGFVLAGSTNSIGAGQSDMYVIRTDSMGNVVWSKTYGGSNSDGARAILELPDRGFFVAGHTQSYGAGGADFYVLRTFYTGDTMWTRTYGDNNSEIAHSADLTQDGGYIVAGLKYGATLDSLTFVVKDGPLEAISCCLDTTGNVDYDLNDLCNIVDLNFLTNKIFRGGPFPPCPEEADLNGDGINGNVVDLDFLVNRFFRGGPLPSHLCNPSKKIKDEQLVPDYFVELK